VLNPGRPSARLVRRQQLILRRMGAVIPPTLETMQKSESPRITPAQLVREQ
jgi:hypothetical protein